MVNLKNPLRHTSCSQAYCLGMAISLIQTMTGTVLRRPHGAVSARACDQVLVGAIQ